MPFPFYTVIQSELRHIASAALISLLSYSLGKGPWLRIGLVPNHHLWLAHRQGGASTADRPQSMSPLGADVYIYFAFVPVPFISLSPRFPFHLGDGCDNFYEIINVLI